VLTKVVYDKLNSRQQENYNFAKISGLLADYGYITMRLSDDWNGADFLAYHINGESVMKVQLKGRIDINKKYIGKSIYIAFPCEGKWYLVPHDEMKDYLLQNSDIQHSESWSVKGGYSIGGIAKKHQEFFNRFVVG